MMVQQDNDERLIQLMTEFLQTTNKDADDSIVRTTHPEYDNAATYHMVQKLTEEVAIFKSQLQDVRKKLLNQSQRETYSGDGLELNAVQNTIADQTTKIGDLEYKISMLKADLEKKKEPKKKTGFGFLGMGLIASNVLLLVALGWFIWNYNRGSSGDTDNQLVKNSGATTPRNASASMQSTDENTLSAEVSNNEAIEQSKGQEKLTANAISANSNQAVLPTENIENTNTSSPASQQVVEKPKRQSANRGDKVVAAASPNALNKGITTQNNNVPKAQKANSSQVNTSTNKVNKKIVAKTGTNQKKRLEKNRSSKQANNARTRKVVQTKSNSGYVPPSQREPQVSFGD